MGSPFHNHLLVSQFAARAISSMWTVRSVRSSRYGFVAGKLSESIRSLHSDSMERVMAIRREDINVWERRAPISPAHVAELANKGIKVLVQPSTRRAYTMDEYEKAGAIITEDLTPASLIIGVKAVPVDLLLPDKTYAFFSHTIKAQEANMPLLDAMLEKVKEFPENLIRDTIFQLPFVSQFELRFCYTPNIKSVLKITL